MCVRRVVWNIFFYPFCLVFLFCAAQVVRMGYFAQQGKELYTALPFEQKVPDPALRILFLGDSTAVGTGAKDNRKTVAGYFADDFPQASITNISKNGQRLRGLIGDWNDFSGSQEYSLIVLQVGANDILRFTPLDKIANDLAILLERAKRHGKNIVLLHSGNVGAAPMFIWPFNRIYEARTKQVRALYQDIARQKGIIYVDLFQDLKDDIFLKDPKVYYAPDYLHPSSAGYAYWYKRIREDMRNLPSFR